MKVVTGLLAAVLLLAGVGQVHAAVLITEDRGGRIGAYMDKYQGLRSSGETVVIDGFCASACTIILAAVPHDKICVTSYANLGFHAAWISAQRAARSPIARRPRCCIRCIPRDTTLDRATRRADIAHDLPARQATGQNVQALLSRRTPLFRCRRIGPSSLIDQLCAGRRKNHRHLSWRPLFSPLAAYRPQPRQQSIEPGPLRRQLNTARRGGSTPRMMPMRANMVGSVEIDDEHQTLTSLLAILPSSAQPPGARRRSRQRPAG